MSSFTFCGHFEGYTNIERMPRLLALAATACCVAAIVFRTNRALDKENEEAELGPKKYFNEALSVEQGLLQKATSREVSIGVLPALIDPKTIVRHRRDLGLSRTCA